MADIAVAQSVDPASSPSSATSGPSSDIRLGPIICPGHSRPVPDLAFTNQTPDGYFLISSCLDNKAMLRDGVTGDWIGTFMGHKGAVWCARLNKEATKAATAAGDFSAKLWDALSGDELVTFSHKHIVKAVEFSHDSRYLYTGGHEKKLRIFDLEAATDVAPTILEHHTAAISHVARVPHHEQLIFTAGGEKNIRVWDRRTNAVAQELQTNVAIHSIQSTLDGSTLVASMGKQVAFYDANNFSLIKSVELARKIDCVSFDPNSKRYVTGSDEELWVRMYDYSTDEEIACKKGHHGPVRSLAFTPSGANYASGSEDGTIRIWSSSALD